MITIKKIKNILREMNVASSGDIRGLGNVTGTAGGGNTGNIDTWINQNITGSTENNQAHHNFAKSSHFDLHKELENNDINPKDKRKKIVIKQEN